MATNFPTGLDTLVNPTANDTVVNVSHADQHANANDAIEAIEAKVGIDSSTDNTTHDFKLSAVADGDKASSLTGTETHTNKTLTSPVLNTPDINGGTIDDVDITNPTINGTVEVDLGSDAEGDIYYRNSGGDLTRLPKGSDDQYLRMNGNIPNWESAAVSAPAIEVSNGTSTQSLTTNGSQRVIVTAYGAYEGLSGSGNVIITLAYDGTTKQTFVAKDENVNAGGGFMLKYSEVPPNQTANVTLSITGGSYVDRHIFIEKYT